MTRTPDPLGTRSAPTLDPDVVREAVARFLAEDIGSGDVTSRLTVPAAALAAGRLVARQPCVMAGLAVAREVFAQVDARIRFDARVSDGDAVSAGDDIVRLTGPARALLTAERTALNVLQRLSGVATVTRRYVEAIAGTGATVSDTRKTTPGLRVFEKYAVRMGGGRNHRIGLFDAALIKDNHLVAAGGVDHALAAVAAGAPGVPLELEVDSLAQLTRALALGVGAVLLDNMSPATVAEAVRLVRAHPSGAACWIEASGGITIENVRAYAEAGVDTISVGALTHSAPAMDLALDFDLPG